MQPLRDKYKNIDYVSNKRYRDFAHFTDHVNEEISHLVCLTKQRQQFELADTENRKELIHIAHRKFFQFFMHALPMLFLLLIHKKHF